MEPEALGSVVNPIHYTDSPEDWKAIGQAIQAGRVIFIVVHASKVDDLPRLLREALRATPKNMKGVTDDQGNFTPDSVASWIVSVAPLIVLAAAAIGAVGGFRVGGGPGAVVGGAAGGVFGLMAVNYKSVSVTASYNPKTGEVTFAVSPAAVETEASEE